MKAEGTFIFKGTEERKGGEFINERGQKITYPDATIVKFDEQINGIIYDRKVKVSNDNVSLLGKLSQIGIYKPVIMSFDINFYKNGFLLNLEDIVEIDK